MNRNLSESPRKKKVVKKEIETKTLKKKKDAQAKEIRSKRTKTEKVREINKPQHDERAAARTRKSRSAEPAAGELKLFSLINLLFLLLICTLREVK